MWWCATYSSRTTPYTATSSYIYASLVPCNRILHSLSLTSGYAVLQAGQSIESRLEGTVALHTMVPCRAGSALAFTPIGSVAKCVNGSFYPDTVGDYETEARVRWKAMQLPPRMGPASDPVRFEDGFERTQTPSVAKQLIHTDAGVRAWQVVGQPQCTATSDGSLHLRCAASGSNSTNGVTTTTALPSSFAEPLSLVLSGVHLKTPAANVAVVLGELTLLVTTRRAAVVPTATPSKTIVSAELHDTSCMAHGVTAIMYSNAANCSVGIQCTTEAKNPPTLWNGHDGVPHGVHCQDSNSPSYDCGAVDSTPSTATV